MQNENLDVHDLIKDAEQKVDFEEMILARRQGDETDGDSH